MTEKPVEWNARFDNRGTEPRGPLQFLVSPTINNLMGQHEALSLTYASAFVADITGHFRTLFIQKPYRQAFRLVRWLVAGLAAIGLIAVIE